MSRTITFVTPENITVTYQVAGFASRFMATVIDLALQFALLLIAFMIMRISMGLSSVAGGVFGVLTFVAIIAVFVVMFGYATLFEMLWGGRTPGKRLFGLRVIREGGYPINMLASCIRNVLRFIDFGIVPLSGATPLILCGLPGLLCIFFSPQYKRIGDYAAGTLVIVEAGSTPFGTRRASTPASLAVTAFYPYVKNLDRLTVEEYRIIRRFTSRRAELDLVVQASIGERLARPLIQKLDMQAPIAFQLQFADLLEAIERRYAEERGVL
jgi:uncharacterized RDD family membrane protein YckC